MAKVTITIEDFPGNRVKTTCDPSFETMMKMVRSGNELTSAHGYALAALNKIMAASKSNKPLPIFIPRVRHA